MQSYLPLHASRKISKMQMLFEILEFSLHLFIISPAISLNFGNISYKTI